MAFPFDFWQEAGQNLDQFQQEFIYFAEGTKR